MDLGSLEGKAQELAVIGSDYSALGSVDRQFQAVFEEVADAGQHPVARTAAVHHNGESSSPREPPPQALTDTDVNVSAHPAPIVQPFHPITASVQTAISGFPLCGLTIVLLFDDGLSGVCISA